ncbi:Zinc finger and SCAN domain-containing 22 [Paramuricea clavata]|uniref:Zinc finger and SCAN domain-containing 22 n=1 Tax=Paramuricea clavata TaxID=317549 RepID=A0A7D9HP90_PARCT|nr:Zinc finger and SCAN domain-containing 22 [Paramuricea clavata]
MAQQHRENMWRDRFVRELENDEINRQLCAVDTFSWSPETQEEILAEWNDWQHDETASTEPSLCCDECGRVFTRSDNLNRHMKSHSDKNHECSRCRKKFNRKDALNRHMKTHSDKDHECSRCHKTFNRKDALNRHVRMHEQRRAQREYTCNICGEVFRNISPLQAHQHDVHQVGRGKRTKTPTRRTKRQRTDEPEPPSSSTRVNEGASTSTVVSEANNNRVFDSPFQINNREDLVQVRTALENIDIHEWAKQQRPNSKWIVMDITNVTFYFTKLRDHPIGRSVRLPKYVLENPAIVSLDCDSNTSLPYEDKLCFFRCLAMHKGCHPKNLERDTHHFYEQYSEDDDFDGVTLEELPELEKLFELNIYVYRLTELHDEDEDKTSIVAQLIQRSHRRYTNSMYLNLYGSHFSYIKNLAMYSKSYCCCKCDKMWKTARALNRHERTCEATIRHVFPGGTYKVPQTIFDLLADEGIEIPEDLKYFPYRATFDFECYFKRETEHPRNTAKLTWEAEHIPLSVSVCSNVPGYDQPKCFVSSGSTSEMIQHFAEYLVEVSQESYGLLLDQFSDVFRHIDERVNEVGENEVMEVAAGEDNEQNTEEQMIEEMVGCLMGLNSEASEDVCGVDEDEVDKAKDVEEKDVVHPLLKLQDKLSEYLQELPILGFNSGKYDINAAKNPSFHISSNTNKLSL